MNFTLKYRRQIYQILIRLQYQTIRAIDLVVRVMAQHHIDNNDNNALAFVWSFVPTCTPEGVTRLNRLLSYSLVQLVIEVFCTGAASN